MDNKIAFIICTNNKLLLNECLLYIDLLEIPEGFSKETIIIDDADSMTRGYNTGMQRTDAKYKVYLHQDVFITNRNFIADLLNVFNMDESIGLVGLVGSEKLPDDAVMWNDRRVGDFYGYDFATTEEKKAIERITSDYKNVQAIDGYLMATQYDIPWRDDILKGWDFYDVSQSLEFIKAGFRVVAPKQNPAWVIHKCGNPALWNYDDSRKVLLKNYNLMGYFNDNSDRS